MNTFSCSHAQEKSMSSIKATSETLSNYWQQQIDKWQISSQSQQAFCKAHNLSYHQFLYWRRKFEDRSSENQNPPSSALVPVLYRPPSTATGLSLVLPSGLELRGLSGDNLSLVQQLLDRLS
jgi:hypothetical protein